MTTPTIEVVACDLTDRDRTAAQLAGCDAAFYLVHAMDQGQGYAERDRDTAASFAAAATAAGVARIIYLGGLGSDADVLSAHLESRREVERLLASGSARVTALRAAMIIGAGSASFEILRYQGIAVRAGDMAALPLLKRFGTAEAVRASAYVYSTTADLDRLADAITSM